MKQLKCENCGAKLRVDDDNKYATCDYCGAKYKLDEDKKTGDTVLKIDMPKIKINPLTPEDQKRIKHTASFIGVISILVPFIIIVTIISIVLLSFTKLNKDIDNANKKVEQENMVLEQKRKVEKFNSKFKKYNINLDLESYELKEILRLVIENNKEDKTPITVIFNLNKTTNYKEIEQIKEKISDECVYEIKYDYDDNGYINELTINEKEKVYTSVFNGIFESYTGKNDCFTSSHLFNRIITNNKTSKRHQITLVYGNYKSSDPTQIENIVKKICPSNNPKIEFKVSYNYDDNGYIKTMIVKK